MRVSACRPLTRTHQCCTTTIIQSCHSAHSFVIHNCPPRGHHTAHAAGSVFEVGTKLRRVREAVVCGGRGLPAVVHAVPTHLQCRQPQPATDGIRQARHRSALPTPRTRAPASAFTHNDVLTHHGGGGCSYSKTRSDRTPCAEGTHARTSPKRPHTSCLPKRAP